MIVTPTVQLPLIDEFRLQSCLPGYSSWLVIQSMLLVSCSVSWPSVTDSIHLRSCLSRDRPKGSGHRSIILNLCCNFIFCFLFRLNRLHHVPLSKFWLMAILLGVFLVDNAKSDLPFFWGSPETVQFAQDYTGWLYSHEAIRLPVSGSAAG